MNLDQLGAGRCAESWLTPGLKEHNPIFLNKCNTIRLDKNRQLRREESLKSQLGGDKTERDRAVAQRKETIPTRVGE